LSLRILAFHIEANTIGSERAITTLICTDI